jgi:hypothetical protein
MIKVTQFMEGLQANRKVNFRERRCVETVAISDESTALCYNPGRRKSIDITAGNQIYAYVSR